MKKPSNRTPALKYLAACADVLKATRRNVKTWTKIGERIAESMLAGGNIYTPPIARFWPYEFGGRAGGLMGIPGKLELPKSAKDIAFIALPDVRNFKPAEHEDFQKLIKLPAQIVVNGAANEWPAGVKPKKKPIFLGGYGVASGEYAYRGYGPLTTLRPLGQFLNGWCTTGEAIAACTRAGKMPVIWMSVWLEGSLPRNAAMTRHDNLREPWSVPLLHDNHYVPPLAAGYPTNAFLDEAEKIHRILVDQATKLSKIGQWFAEATRAGRKPYVVAVGHSYPEILELPEQYPIEWGPTRSDLSRSIPRRLGKGDVVMHLGYAPVNVDHVRAVLDRGIRFIHTSPYGRPAALKDHPNFIWLDLPWRPADATVDVPGYSVRIMPMSSTVHTMAYFAIVAEMAERMGWK